MMSSYISMLEAQTRAHPLVPLSADTLQLSLTNLYRRRTLVSFPDC